MAKKKAVSFQEFLQLCKDADQLLTRILEEPSRLQGRHPMNLKAAAVWLLARQKGLHITMHHLYLIYGSQQQPLMKIHKLIEKAAVAHKTKSDSFGGRKPPSLN